jgi:hypothetical protein
LAAPLTPPEAVDEVIASAKSGERQTHAEIKGKIDKIKRVKATAAGIKPGSSKKRTKAEGSTAPEQVQPEERILLPDAVNRMLLDIQLDDLVIVLAGRERVDRLRAEVLKVEKRHRVAFAGVGPAAFSRGLEQSHRNLRMRVHRDRGQDSP